MCMGLPIGDKANLNPEVRAELNELLRSLSAVERINFVLSNIEGNAVLSSSFGIQSAVSLHLITQIQPNIPVILIDTGYLFSETYRFIDQLSDRLNLNLKIVRPDQSPRWLEARHGELWNQGASGLKRYNQIAKIQPMQRALEQLSAAIWFAGIRRSQAASRQSIPYAKIVDGRWNIHPIADWADRDVHLYLKRHNLPRNPLWEQGYLSVGDTHTTKSIYEVQSVDETRFFGLQRECGLHLDG